jgi:hypothetical protein
MESIPKITIASLFLVAAALLFWQSASSATGRFNLLRATSTAADFASTSVKFLDAATRPTTTMAFASANTDHIDLNIQYNASGTPSTLQFTVEHSDNEVDWFCEGGAPVTSTGSTTIHTYGARCPLHAWTPGVAGISRRSIPLTDLGTRFMRIRFSSKDGNGSIYAEPILRQPN